MAQRTQERHHARNPGVAHEPSIDYVVTKIPRFAFEKFPQADPTLTTQMKGYVIISGSILCDLRTALCS